MIPIFEQGKSKGIGHRYDTFIKRFQEICKDHIASKRAHAFAFIFYDFENEAIKKILKDTGGFAQLDRLSGNKLSIFYLHSRDKELIDSFNNVFRYAFEVDEEVSLPFVLFLKFDGDVEEIEDMKISVLEQDNYLFAFKELYSTIETYIKQIDGQNNEMEGKINKLIKVANKYKKIALEEFIRIIFQNIYKNFTL